MAVQVLSRPFTFTATCVVVAAFDAQPHVLLTRSVGPGWQLPTADNGDHLSLEDAASNYLGKATATARLQQVATYSRPDRRTDKREIATSFLVVPRNSELTGLQQSIGGNTHWFAVNNLPDLGYDHQQIVRDALERLREYAQREPILFQLLPPLFTLSDAQRLQEELLGKKLHRPNFRRTLAAYPFLEKTNRKRTGVKGGPALYRANKAKF